MPTSLEISRQLTSKLHSTDRARYQEICNDLVEQKWLELSPGMQESLLIAWQSLHSCITREPMDRLSVVSAASVLSTHIDAFAASFKHDDIIVSVENILSPASEKILQLAQSIQKDPAKYPEDLQTAAQIVAKNEPDQEYNEAATILANEILFEKISLPYEEILELAQIIIANPNDYSESLRTNAVSALELGWKSDTRGTDGYRNAAAILAREIKKEKHPKILDAATYIRDHQNQSPQHPDFAGALKLLEDWELIDDRGEKIAGPSLMTESKLAALLPLNITPLQAKQLRTFVDHLNEYCLQLKTQKELIACGIVIGHLTQTLEHLKVMENDAPPNVAVLPPDDDDDDNESRFIAKSVCNSFSASNAADDKSKNNHSEVSQIFVTAKKNIAETHSATLPIQQKQLHEQAFFIASECATYLTKISTNEKKTKPVRKLHHEIYNILSSNQLSTVEKAVKVYEQASDILEEPNEDFANLKHSIQEFGKWFKGDQEIEKFKQSSSYLYLITNPHKEQESQALPTIYTELLKQTRPSTKQTYLLSFLDERNLYTRVLNGVINNCVLYLILHPYPTIKHDGQEFAFKWISYIYTILSPKLNEQGAEVEPQPPISQFCDIYRYALDNFDKTKGELYENIIAQLEEILFGEKLKASNLDKVKRLDLFKSSDIYTKLTEQPVETIPLPNGVKDGLTLGMYKQQLLSEHRLAINKPIEFYLEYRDIKELSVDEQHEFLTKQKTMVDYVLELGKKVLNFFFSTNRKIWNIAQPSILKESANKYSPKPEIKFEAIAATMAAKYNRNVQEVKSCSVEANPFDQGNEPNIPLVF